MTENFPSQTGLYKVLNTDLKPRMGTGPAYVVGKRRSARGPLVPCVNGLHACTLEKLPRWLGPSIHPVLKASKERIEHGGDKWVCRSLTIGEAYPTWNERTMRLWACDCAEHVLPIFERHCPTDTRPREAIETARRFASGVATQDQLDTACRAARAAADDAADSRSPEERAADSRSPEERAANAAADAADAAYAANAAADAAAYAAYAAAADHAQECAWQAERLAQYLSGELA